MRSRYVAFARGEVAYLLKTLHPSQRGLETGADLRRTVESTRWTGLRVLDTEAGTEGDDEGQVEFVAFFEQGGGKGQLYERSVFRREAGRWFYVDAMMSRRRDPPARGDSCWCGSGERFKRCHGR